MRTVLTQPGRRTTAASRLFGAIAAGTLARAACAALGFALATATAAPAFAITLNPEATVLAPFDFGSVEIGSMKSQVFVATSSSASNDVSTSWRLSGLFESPFSLVSSTCNVEDGTLGVPSTCSFELKFSPTSAVTSNLFLGLENFYNEGGIGGAPNRNSIAILVRGTGVPASVAPVPLPAAAWLLLGGLGALGAIARRKRAA